MPRLIERLRREDDGFTLVVVLGMLVVVLGFTLVALQTVINDQGVARYNQDGKSAQAAAEAGVSSYSALLNQSSDMWRQCAAPTGITQPAPAAPEWSSVGPASTGRFTIELMPASGTTCDTANPQTSMMNPDGTLRVRVTGEGRPGANGARAPRRSIVASFKRRGYLDYVQFTDKEVTAPSIFARIFSCNFRYMETDSFDTESCGATSWNGNTATGLYDWAQQKCSGYWRGATGRSTTTAFPGQILTPAATSGPYDQGGLPNTLTWQNYTTWFQGNAPTNQLSNWTPFNGLFCQEAPYRTGETFAGPVHTNDTLTVCGTPAFGRASQSPKDLLEVVAATTDPAVRLDGSTGCTGSALNTGNVTYTPGADSITPPSSATFATQMASVANFTYTGGTLIDLRANGTATVKNNGTISTITLPASGVIWVDNAGGCAGYDPVQTPVVTGAGEPCGDVVVKGSYKTNLTIASNNDIVISDDVTRDAAGPSALLGLVANQFVRIQHSGKPGLWKDTWTPKASFGSPTFDGPSAYDAGNPGPHHYHNSNGASDDQPTAYPWARCHEDDKVDDRTHPPPTKNLRVDAAILAFNGSFLTDRWGCGWEMGTLTLRGAVIQAYDGAVGTPWNGLQRNYTYDPLFAASSPPYFPTLPNAAWTLARQAEAKVPSAYVS